MIENILRLIRQTAHFCADDGKTIAEILDGSMRDGMLLVHDVSNGAIPGKSFSFEEQFHSPEKMLLCQLEDILESGAHICDAPLCVRPNFGTIVIPAMMGCGFAMKENQYPWITGHLSKEAIKSFTPDDIDDSPMMAKCLEYLSYYKENLPDSIHVYLPDTQGPFDLAHLVYGDDLFYEMYDDPAFVHELMALCTDVYIRATRRMKQAIGEKDEECFHGHACVRGIRLRRGGARISEDTATLISPQAIEEFVLPYDKRALAAFGGGFVHYCGRSEALLDAYLAMDEVYAVNFGNPEMYDFAKLMDAFDASGKVYFGHFPNGDGESPETYLRRIKYMPSGEKRRILFRYNSDMFPLPVGEILAMWKEL